MRISAGSLAFSWIIALLLLAGIGIISKPPHYNDKVQVISFPAPAITPDDTQLTDLKARVWCTLDSNQVASIKILGREQRFRGAMAIDPKWRGASLSQQANALVNDCVRSHVNSQDFKSRYKTAVPASLAFAFSHL